MPVDSGRRLTAADQFAHPEPPVRARGITVIALVVAWLGVSVAFLSLARPVREWAGEEWPLYLTAAALHGIAAWVAAYGLWERRAWAPVAFRAWSAAAAVAAFLPLIISRHPATPLWPALLGMLLGSALLVLLNRYVRRLTQG